MQVRMGRLRPVGGPAAVLAYLSRYTHRVAIPNGRLTGSTATASPLRWKDYRAEGRERQKLMTLASNEITRCKVPPASTKPACEGESLLVMS